MRRSNVSVGALFLLSLALSGGGPAKAQDKLKIAIGQLGNWDTAAPHLCVVSDICKKANLDLELLYTKGGGETQQAVIAASADVGVAAGTLGVLGAFSKGAPVRIIGGQATGAADYWYVRADSPIKLPADAADKTMAYSTNGSSTHSMVLGFVEKYKVAAKPTSTGGPPGTFTSVMSGQIDIGWAAPPFGLDALAENKIRLFWRGNDLERVQSQTVRVLIANADRLKANPEVFKRFVQAYKDTVVWMHTNDAAIKAYGEFAKTSEANVQRVRNEFFTQSMIDPTNFKGTADLVEDAVKFKYTDAKLTDVQIKELIQIPAVK